jgi:hypothetical protein
MKCKENFMRKIFAINLALITLLFFFACSKDSGSNRGSLGSVGGSTASGPVAPSSPAPSGSAAGGKAAVFFNMFSSGTYHMKAKMTGGGMETTVETYTKDGMMATILEAAGQKSRMIFRDNAMHIINDEDKTVMSLPSMGNATEEAVKTDGMILTSSGTAMFDGKNLSYEEYSDEEGNRVQYFLDGNKLAGIRNIMSEGTIDVVILVLDQNVPASVFDIPSSYQKLSLF